MRINN